jgi:glycosyltransferase involved in cell wall biosynthesis
MKRTILLFGNHPPPYGGVPVHIKYIATKLTENGWKVHVLALNGNSKFGRNKVEFGDYLVHRPSKLVLYFGLLQNPTQLIKSFRIKEIFRFRDYISRMKMSFYVDKLCLENKIYLISAYHLDIGIFCTLASKKYKIPVVITIFGEIYSRTNFYNRNYDLVQDTVTRSLNLLSCSQHCANSLRKIGFDRKVEVVYHGVDINRFPMNLENSSFLLKKYSIKDESPIVLFVGRMTEEMGLDVLLKAIPGTISKSGNIIFFIVGAKGSKTKAALQLQKSNPSHVFVEVDVSQSEIAMFYAVCTVVVVPSTNERACLGLAIIEAMLSKKPVIVSNVGGGQEVVSIEDRKRMIQPNCHISLSNSILETIATPKHKLLQVGETNRSRAIEKFSLEKTFNKMHKIFIDAL